MVNMPRELIPSFLFYCVLSCISPGPSNLATLSASLNCGKQRAMRQWHGMTIGFSIEAMIAVMICYLLGKVVGGYVHFLSYIGAAYIIYLGIGLLRSESDSGEENSMPYGFRTGLIVQVTNAQGLIFCITTLSAYVLAYHGSLWMLFFVGCFLTLTSVMCNLVWLYAGVSLQSVFRRHRRAINIVMALSLIACAVNLAIS